MLIAVFLKALEFLFNFSAF